jgi:ribosome-binding protein aMBF1 (putative translation factor)
MSERDESKAGTTINPEVEEDGLEHLRDLLEGNAEFRRIWEEQRAGREVGLLVLKRRLELGISQKELAERVGTSQNRIYVIESGDANPTLETLQRLATVLKVPLEIRPVELAGSPGKLT